MQSIPPGAGPIISVDDFRRAVGLPGGDPSDDLYVGSLLDAAVEVVETACNRPMGPREATFDLPSGLLCGGIWWFPVAPVASVGAVEGTADHSAWVALDPDDWRLETAHDTPRLALNAAPTSTALRVRATVGHEADAVPRGMVQAAMLMAKEWFEAGISLEEAPQKRVFFGSARLMRRERYRRPAEWTPCR